MKRLLVLLLPMLVLPACGPRSVDSELKEYVKRFEKVAGTEVSSSVQFKELDTGLVGLCEPDLIRNEVWIDPRAWEETEGDDLARELIVFHELGHCELSRSHDNRLDSNGVPRSIMHKGPLTRLVEAYRGKRDAYVEELIRN